MAENKKIRSISWSFKKKKEKTKKGITHLLSSFCHFQAEGLKEGDFIITVGDTDCKWFTVSEVMRLLKDVDEEMIDIQVVSMMESNPQMVRRQLLRPPTLPLIQR